MFATGLGLLAGRAWAMEPGTVETFRRVAMASREERLTPEALQSQLGRKLEGTRAVAVRDGVAVVPVVGPIFRRANLFTAISGATSTELLARDIRAAVESPEVKAVLLEIDSPGGEAMGICELAALVAAMRKRKPVHAYADGYCCSGAYWLAAACESIVASPTAVLGSIGVVVSMFRRGEDEVEIVSSVSPRKRPDPSTEEGRAEVQRWVDQLAEVFVSDVARYRAVTEEKVRKDFGAGGVLVGRHAVRAGLADRLGLLEGMLPRLAAGQSAHKAVAEVTAEGDDWTEVDPTFFCTPAITLKSAYDGGESDCGLPGADSREGAKVGEERESPGVDQPELLEEEEQVVESSSRPDAVGGSREEAGAEAGSDLPESQTCDATEMGREPGPGVREREEDGVSGEAGGMSDAGGVNESAYAEMQERLRRAEARTAALEAAEARREVTAALSGKRFLGADGNPGYGLAAASRERLTEALMVLDPEARGAVVAALTEAQLVPIGTVGFPTAEGSSGEGDPESLSAADRAVIRAEAKRRRVPETEVEQQFLAARRERATRREGGSGE